MFLEIDVKQQCNTKSLEIIVTCKSKYTVSRGIMANTLNISQHIGETTLGWTVWILCICFCETVLTRCWVVKVAAYQLSG